MVNSLTASKLLQAGNKSENQEFSSRPVSPDYCGSIAPDIPLTEEQYSSVQSVLHDLKDLHVCTTFRTRTPAHIMDAPTCIAVLIYVAPRLERLSISQDYFFGELSSKIQFNRLKELRIHSTWVYSEYLKSFLLESKETLAVFTLFEVTMECISPLLLQNHSSLWYSQTQHLQSLSLKPQ